MDSTKNQVTALNDKVDRLCLMVEQLNIKLAEAMSEMGKKAITSTEPPTHRFSDDRYPYYQSYSRPDSTLTHKDVLVDAKYPDSGSQSREKDLAPEIQIQRLTAQLTAAYNRIAALEEQLLAKRIH